MDERYALPHGAIGIEGSDFAVEFRSDKVVFILKSRACGSHYTLHVGNQSGVLDLHETRLNAAGERARRTLFAIHRDDFTATVSELTPLLRGFLGLFRRLRLGWLDYRGISIARGIDPVSDHDIAAVTRKRGRRLILDERVWQEQIRVSEYVDEVSEFPDGVFSLLRHGRKIGIGFKKTGPNGKVQLFWVRLRDLVHFISSWQTQVVAAMSRDAIPEERYVDYPFLVE